MTLLSFLNSGEFMKYIKEPKRNPETRFITGEAELKSMDWINSQKSFEITLPTPSLKWNLLSGRSV